MTSSGGGQHIIRVSKRNEKGGHPRKMTSSREMKKRWPPKKIAEEEVRHQGVANILSKSLREMKKRWPPRTEHTIYYFQYKEFFLKCSLGMFFLENSINLVRSESNTTNIIYNRHA
jgi:hypothetical protein